MLNDLRTSKLEVLLIKSNVNWFCCQTKRPFECLTNWTLCSKHFIIVQKNPSHWVRCCLKMALHKSQTKFTKVRHSSLAWPAAMITPFGEKIESLGHHRGQLDLRWRMNRWRRNASSLINGVHWLWVSTHRFRDSNLEICREREKETFVSRNPTNRRIIITSAEPGGKNSDPVLSTTSWLVWKELLFLKFTLVLSETETKCFTIEPEPGGQSTHGRAWRDSEFQINKKLIFRLSLWEWLVIT